MEVRVSETDYRYGGSIGGRDLEAGDRFEETVLRLFGDRVFTSETHASELWGALSNVTWKHVEGRPILYSFRAAGDLVAILRRDGSDYIDWYCSSIAGVVPQWIAERMAAEGWSHDAGVPQ